MTLRILNTKEKAEIQEKLREQFGIEEIPGLLIQTGEERIFLFTGNLEEKEIRRLEKTAVIEKIGVYFATLVNNEIRLSIEGTHILKNQIKKNIFELNKEQAEEWMKGRELNIKIGKKGFIILKHGDDLLGCGKASEEKITNFIPKMRRLKEK